MSSYYLYIVQCNFHRIETAIQELHQICLPNDIIVLMEDAIFALQHPLIQHFHTVKILGNEHHLLQHLSHAGRNLNIEKIDYDTLSDLIQHATKTHSWR